MPRVRVVLPAALSPAMAIMTGRRASAASWRHSRMSLSGMVVFLASATPGRIALDAVNRHGRHGPVLAASPQRGGLPGEPGPGFGSGTAREGRACQPGFVYLGCF